MIFHTNVSIYPFHFDCQWLFLVDHVYNSVIRHNPLDAVFLSSQLVTVSYRSGKYITREQTQIMSDSRVPARIWLIIVLRKDKLTNIIKFDVHRQKTFWQGQSRLIYRIWIIKDNNSRQPGGIRLDSNLISPKILRQQTFQVWCRSNYFRQRC